MEVIVLMNPFTNVLKSSRLNPRWLVDTKHFLPLDKNNNNKELSVSYVALTNFTINKESLN